MSAALPLPLTWERGAVQAAAKAAIQATSPSAKIRSRGKSIAATEAKQESPPACLALYRRHTESLLRRYLYASMQVGRSPSILSDPIGRGWASSRPVRTFEDAVIFVLDVERCLVQISSLDREMLSRIVLQEYTQAEAATLLGMSVRALSYKFPQALDRLTEKVLAAGLLVIST
jgi:hypothetical protein